MTARTFPEGHGSVDWWTAHADNDVHGPIRLQGRDLSTRSGFDDGDLGYRHVRHWLNSRYDTINLDGRTRPDRDDDPHCIWFTATTFLHHAITHHLLLAINETLTAHNQPSLDTTRIVWTNSVHNCAQINGRAITHAARDLIDHTTVTIPEAVVYATCDTLYHLDPWTVPAVEAADAFFQLFTGTFTPNIHTIPTGIAHTRKIINTLHATDPEIITSGLAATYARSRLGPLSPAAPIPDPDEYIADITAIWTNP